MVLQDQESAMEGINLLLPAAAAIAGRLASDCRDGGAVGGSMQKPAGRSGEQCDDDDHWPASAAGSTLTRQASSRSLTASP